jgi:hypothetical protein
MADTYENKNPRMVTGLFNDRDSAERAYNAVTERGYSRDDVNLIMSDETRNRYFAGDQSIETELGTKAAEGAGIGAGIGGALGAIAAAVAAVGTSIALPGLGLVIAGPLAAALAGAGAGGAAGGLLGALIGSGIPEERVKHYEEGLRRGGILMGVTPRSDEDAMHFEQKWRESSGEHIVGTRDGALRNDAAAPLGMAAGATIGGAIGTVGGPVGMAAGAAIGGISGGLLGANSSEDKNPEEGDDLAGRNTTRGR